MKNKKKIMLVVVISLVLALLLSTGGYFTYKYFELKNSKEETKNELQNNQSQEQDKQENINDEKEENKENNNDNIVENDNKIKLNFVGDKEDLISSSSGSSYEVYYINKDSELVYYHVQQTEPYDVIKEKASIPEKVVQINRRSGTGGGEYVFALTERGSLYIRKSPGSIDHKDINLYSFIKVTSPEEIVGLEYENFESLSAHNSTVKFIGKSGKIYYEICEEDYDKGIVSGLTLTDDANKSEVCYFK